LFSGQWPARFLEAPRVVLVERIAEGGLFVKVFGKVTPQSRFDAAGELRRFIVEECARQRLVIGWRAVPDGPSEAAAAAGKSLGPQEPDATTVASADPTHDVSDTSGLDGGR